MARIFSAPSEPSRRESLDFAFMKRCISRLAKVWDAPYSRPMARESASERLRWVFDLYEFGEATLRAKLRRRFPGSSGRAIEARIVEWLERRRGAESGDAVGRPGVWPRKRG